MHTPPAHACWHTCLPHHAFGMPSLCLHATNINHCLCCETFLAFCCTFAYIHELYVYTTSICVCHYCTVTTCCVCLLRAVLQQQHLARADRRRGCPVWAGGDTHLLHTFARTALLPLLPPALPHCSLHLYLLPEQTGLLLLLCGVLYHLTSHNTHPTQQALPPPPGFLPTTCCRTTHPSGTSSRRQWDMGTVEVQFFCGINTVWCSHLLCSVSTLSANMFKHILMPGSIWRQYLNSENRQTGWRRRLFCVSVSL